MSFLTKSSSSPSLFFMLCFESFHWNPAELSQAYKVECDGKKDLTISSMREKLSVATENVTALKSLMYMCEDHPSPGVNQRVVFLQMRQSGNINKY